MTIAGLLQLVPPPLRPVEATGSWQFAEVSMGTPLPDDYKAFVTTFGSGRLGDFVCVLNPFAKGSLNLLATSHALLTGLRELREGFPKSYPIALFPERGGLLPAAVTDNGDVIHWATNERRGDWDIIVEESRGSDFERFPCDLTSFLAEVLSGARYTRAFGSLSARPRRFDPATLR